MNFAGHIARRYLRSRRHSRFLSRGSVTAIVGIAIGVAVLNVTLAIMNGFEREMHRTFVENMPMISIITGAPEGFRDLGATMDRIGADPDVIGVAPYVRQEVLVSSARTVGMPRPQAGLIWGIDPDLVGTVQPLEGYLLPNPGVLGALGRGDTPRVILGAELAARVIAAVGDTVILTSVNGELDLEDIQAVSGKFVVVGFFQSNMFELDSRFVYADYREAGRFLGYRPGGVTLLGVRVREAMAADEAALRLEDELGSEYRATDWMALNRNLFEWMVLEERIMALLLGMIILIAGFNIIGILTMMVGERRREIGILLAMGAHRRQIMGIFLLNGLWLGVLGVFFGSVAGLAGIWFLDTQGIGIPSDVYIVDTIPVQLEWLKFGLIALLTLAMALLAGLWPSWEAANLKPMDIIRYS